MSNPDFIGDNYETSVIFIVSGYQYISLAAAFNFGSSFQQNWFCSYVFVFLFLLFTAIQFGMTLYLPDLAMKLLTAFFHVGEAYFITTTYMIARGLKSYLELSHAESLALYHRNRFLSSQGNCTKATYRPQHHFSRLPLQQILLASLTTPLESHDTDRMGLQYFLHWKRK